MLSVANVRSPSAAANYFAADNYYASADADRSGTWVGKGATMLGLEGRVEAKSFDALLRGELPDGTKVGNANQPHRPGTDLTFSLPKSWSLLALVGGDKRIIEAYREAVIETLGWAEKNAAETRLVRNGKTKTVSTGNLTVGLFQHDTNRSQEPNLHFHAVVANVTKGPDGRWRTLKNDRLWSLNTLLNSMTMARFRMSVEKLGYQTGPVGKHGNFEASGIDRSAVMAFSTRRQEVLDARRGPGLRAGVVAALATRAPKDAIEDRDALVESWKATAASIGLDLADMVCGARERAALLGAGQSPRLPLVERGIALLREFAARVRGDPADPLVPKHVLKKDAPTIASAQAVVSAVRHLGQREAAFPREKLLKTALDFGLPTTIDHVETRVNALVRSGDLLKGRGPGKGWLASREAIAIEQRILAHVEAGRGAAPPILTSETAGARVQAVAALGHGLTLNDGQEAAARLILSSHNRTVAVQGVAGAGKSSLLKPTAEVLREEGKSVHGLAVQNTLVQMLERDTGIASTTLARFLGKYRKLLDDPGNASLLREARNELGDHVLLLDEASMVSNREKERLVQLANLARVDRLVLIGDRKQLGAVDAGKPFDLVQTAGIERAVMNLNLRARDKQLRRAQSAAQAGQVSEALGFLKDHIVETDGDSAVVAAERWLSLSPEERERTAIYASGRVLRSAVNEAVQTGLRANGELGTDALKLAVLSRVNATREELRYISAYKPGMLLEARGADRIQKLGKGQYRITSVDPAKKEVVLADAKGRQHWFRPGRIRPGLNEDRLALFEQKRLNLHAGDRIRWTENDHKRGLFNADQAHVIGIDERSVTLVTSAGMEHRLKRGDPMLRRLDLAYALNAHMAQGLTSDRGIAVMDSREKNLSNQQTFLVTVTRLRDRLTLVIDNVGKLQSAIARNPGSKSSAIEITGRLRDAAAKGLSKGEALPPSGPEKPELAKDRVKPFEIGI
ncbi:MobF family relaxase [Novosphingopyxis sp.]|uniref:MobF family relaxase n=1 Tax=Novosphingopyxis sp. TaxID=2709690 RepID=UPI003B5B95E4